MCDCSHMGRILREFRCAKLLRGVGTENRNEGKPEISELLSCLASIGFSLWLGRFYYHYGVSLTANGLSLVGLTRQLLFLSFEKMYILDLCKLCRETLPKSVLKYSKNNAQNILSFQLDLGGIMEQQARRPMFQLSGKSTAASAIQFFRKWKYWVQQQQVVNPYLETNPNKPIDTFEVLQHIKFRSSNDKKFKISCYLFGYQRRAWTHKKNFR